MKNKLKTDAYTSRKLDIGEDQAQATLALAQAGLGKVALDKELKGMDVAERKDALEKVQLSNNLQLMLLSG